MLRNALPVNVHNDQVKKHLEHHEKFLSNDFLLFFAKVYLDTRNKLFFERVI